MKKTLILHIGMLKTGTTSIQETLNKSFEILKRHSVYYPSDLHPHNISFFPIFHENPYDIPDWKKRYKKEQAFEKQQEIKQQWISKFQNNKCDNFIISSELLSLWNEELILKAKNFVDPYFDEVKVLVYLRPHLSFYPSLIQQEIKNGFKNYGIDQHLKLQMERFNYKSIIQRWEKIFGKDNIIVRPFDKNAFKNGDLLDDFFDSIGLNHIDSKILNKENRNVSIGKYSVVLLAELNKKYPVFIGGDLNKERGLATRFIPINVFKAVKDEKFSLDIKLNKEQAKRINEEISFVNNYFSEDYQFEYVKASNDKTKVPTPKDIPIDYFVELVNEYHKYIEQLLNRIDNLKGENQKKQKRIEELINRFNKIKIENEKYKQRVFELEKYLNNCKNTVNNSNREGRLNKLESVLDNKSEMRKILFSFYKVQSKRKMRRLVNLIQYIRNKNIALFDEEYYLYTYPDIKDKGIKPLKHYVLFGAYEGRNPNPTFNTIDYICENPELALTGENPLFHYAKANKMEK